MEKINLKTTRRIELIDITKDIQKTISNSKIKNGVCFIFCPHTTAGLTINENADPSVKTDILFTLERLIPEKGHYMHTEGNADSHIKSSLFGASLSVFFENGQLQLGTWQGIYFFEGDGPRSRQVWIKILVESV